MQQSLRASMRLSASLHLDDSDAEVAGAGSEGGIDPMLSLDEMGRHWSEAKQLQAERASLTAEIEARTVTMSPRAALNSRLFALNARIEVCVAEARRAELASPILTRTAAQSIQLQADQIEWMWQAADGDEGAAARGPLGMFRSLVPQAVKNKVMWSKGTPSEVRSQLQQQPDRDRALVLRFKNAPGKKQSLPLESVDEAVQWLATVTRPEAATSAAGGGAADSHHGERVGRGGLERAFSAARFKPPEGHDVVDVFGQIAGTASNIHVNSIISELQNTNVWRKIPTQVNYGEVGGDDQGLRLTLSNGRLSWSKPGDGYPIGSLDPCDGIRRIRSFGTGFVGRQDNGVLIILLHFSSSQHRASKPHSSLLQAGGYTSNSRRLHLLLLETRRK